jgi:hypothetical protein
LKLLFHHFSTIKSHKEVTKSRNQGFSYFFCLMIEGSGSRHLSSGSVSGSRRPKNIRDYESGSASLYERVKIITFSTKPVAMGQLVGVAVQAEFVKCHIAQFHLPKQMRFMLIFMSKCAFTRLFKKKELMALWGLFWRLQVRNIAENVL